MVKIKKFASYVTAAIITAGILLGSVPTSASASTSSKLVQQQNSLKKQVSAYNKTLSNYKKAIKENDEYAYYELYMQLQKYNKDFVKYNYTGKDVLAKKITSYRARLDRSRKDNIAVDLKKTAASFNTYIKKADAKKAKELFTKQKAKLIKVLMYQDDLIYDMEDYVYDVEEQVYTENEIYIHNQLPTEFEAYDTESAKLSKSFLELSDIHTEIESYAYKVLNMDYPLYMQIQNDIEAISSKYFDEEDEDEEDAFYYDLYDDGNLDEAIYKRDVLKAKLALINATNKTKEFNEVVAKFKAELIEYKNNLTVKFADKVKEKPAEETTENTVTQ